VFNYFLCEIVLAGLPAISLGFAIANNSAIMYGLSLFTTILALSALLGHSR